MKNDGKTEVLKESISSRDQPPSIFTKAKVNTYVKNKI